MPTLIFEDKFNTGGTWTSSGGTPTISASPTPPSGGQVLLTNAIGEYVRWGLPATGITRLVWGVWLQIPAAPTTASTRVFKIDPGLTEGWMYLHDPLARPYVQSDGTPSIPQADMANDFPLNTWTWTQLMFDLSANPWQLQAKIGSDVVSSTGAAAASNFDDAAARVSLGTTSAPGDVLGLNWAHVKLGIAADDNDWWAEPSSADPDRRSMVITSRGVGW